MHARLFMCGLDIQDRALVARIEMLKLLVNAQTLELECEPKLEYALFLVSACRATMPQ